uniref:Uncharacterized protein n=1 Tax=Macrostomum lignano TaxID=282301 RepID=A0A1I8FNH4_9PLAT
MAATIDNEDDGDMNQALESQRSIQDGVEGDLLWILKAARRQGKRSSVCSCQQSTATSW